jgi:predicted Rossmann fold nucleotide-binding protein DprA/Smf involved in DNA uptake
MDADALGRRSGFDSGRLAVALLELELAGRVGRDAGRILLTGR